MAGPIGISGAAKGFPMLGDVSAASALLLAAFLVLSAFFSGSEAALLSVQRVRLRHLVNTKTAGASRVARMVEHPEKLLPPILLGNNLVNTGAAAVATSLALTLITDESVALAVATAAVTTVLLVFGETIPKTVAARHAERTSIIIAPAIQALSWALRPFSFILLAISTGIAKLFGGGSARDEVTQEEIKSLVQFGSERGAVEQGEADMIRRVLEFGDRHVSEFMTPRPEIVSVTAGATIGDFLALYSDNYHTRFPVVRDNLDDVVGLVSVKDVMRQLAAGVGLDSSVTAGARPARFVPETKLVNELFDEMRASGDQIVMVADEFGGVAGLVTLKRLVEGIVGRVRDEEQPGGQQEVLPLDENTVELDGGLSISEANERLGLDIPTGDYETVAGFLLEILGSIPVEGTVALYRNLRFAVLEMRAARIVRVRVTRSFIEE